MESILHIVPNYLGLQVGVDKFGSPFKGEMQKWTMMYGFGAFISLKKEGYADMLIFYNEVKPNNIFNWVS